MSIEKRPYILVYGVSVYDIIGFSYDHYRTQDSNPGRVKVSFGGVCRNIAENLVRLNLNTKFISIVGDDEKGHSILKHAEGLNLDMKDSLIVSGESTPTYMAILNEHGEMQSAIVDMKIMDCITAEFIDSKASIIEESEYMIMGTDNPCMVEHILTTYQGKTNFILDPVSSVKVSKIKKLIPYFHTIKPNRIEAECLCGFPIRTLDDVRKAGKYFLQQGVKSVIISLDVDGMYYTNGTEEGILKAGARHVVNVTGAGDSCVAGIGYGYMNQLSLKETVKYAIAMSIITIEHEETIHPRMSSELVEQYIQELRWTETKFY